MHESLMEEVMFFALFQSHSLKFSRDVKSTTPDLRRFCDFATVIWSVAILLSFQGADIFLVTFKWTHRHLEGILNGNSPELKSMCASTSACCHCSYNDFSTWATLRLITLQLRLCIWWLKKDIVHYFHWVLWGIIILLMMMMVIVMMLMTVMMILLIAILFGTLRTK